MTREKQMETEKKKLQTLYEMIMMRWKANDGNFCGLQLNFARSHLFSKQQQQQMF